MQSALFIVFVLVIGLFIGLMAAVFPRMRWIRKVEESYGILATNVFILMFIHYGEIVFPAIMENIMAGPMGPYLSGITVGLLTAVVGIVGIFIAAVSMKSEGKVNVPFTRAIVTLPSSRGCRMTSRAFL